MSLLTVSRYVELTGDSTSPSASVSAAIGDAERMIVDYLRRPLELGDYTDSLHVDVAGRVYPKASPVTAVPADSDYSIIDTRTLGYLTGDPSFITETYTPATGYLVDQPLRDVAYTGGWTADTAPFGVLRAISRVAYRVANPRPMSDDTGGASSRKVSDVSVSYPAGTGAPGDAQGRSTVEALAPGTETALNSYVWSEDYD